MKIEKIVTVFFSPTGTTKKVVQAIASGFGDVPMEEIDLTPPAAIAPRQLAPTELAIIGVPVYAGRVAAIAARRLQAVTGDTTPAVVVAVYGNREFEDALIELRDIAEKTMFVPIAAGAFIGEHSFSGPDMPIGAGRPDAQDLTEATAFGSTVAEKLAAMSHADIRLCPEIPGNRPYKEGMGKLPFTPSVLQDRCTQCGVCVSACPTGAISLAESITVDGEKCIFCCSCLKSCPEAALRIDAPSLLEKRQWLYEQCHQRKEIQLFV